MTGLPESWLSLLDFDDCESTDGWNDDREARYRAAIVTAKARFKQLQKEARRAERARRRVTT